VKNDESVNAHGGKFIFNHFRNLEREYQREQARLQVLQRKHQAVDETRGKHLFGSPEGRAEIRFVSRKSNALNFYNYRAEVREMMQRQLQEKEAKRRQELEMERDHRSVVESAVRCKLQHNHLSLNRYHRRFPRNLAAKSKSASTYVRLCLKTSASVPCLVHPPKPSDLAWLVARGTRRASPARTRT